MGKRGNIKLFQPRPQKVKVPVQELDSIILGCVVFNEEDRLPGFLKDHERFADRFIVIDQSSTDKTGDIAASHKNVDYHRVSRFEHLGEASFNVLQQLIPQTSFLLLLGVDERISAEHYTELRKRATMGRQKYGLKAFWLHRKNQVDGRDMNHLFKTSYDPECMDWQLRLGYGFCIRYQNVPHTHPEPMQPWAYVDPDVYLTHQKTLTEELDSIRKRAGSLNAAAGRDLAYLEGLKKEFGEEAVQL
jgi:hypothetical protein